jgi:hypothetical protein
MAVRREKNWIILFLVLLVGIVLGGFFGEYIGAYKGFEWLRYGQEFGMKQPLILDLSIIKMTLGISFKISIAGILGLACALFCYKII